MLQVSLHLAWKSSMTKETVYCILATSIKTKAEKTVEYRRISGEEHALLRPDTYVGSIELVHDTVIVLSFLPACLSFRWILWSHVIWQWTHKVSVSFSLKNWNFQPMWVYENGRVIKQNVTFSPALLKIFDEILVNAADNKVRDPKNMTEIRIKVDQ